MLIRFAVKTLSIFLYTKVIILRTAQLIGELEAGKIGSSGIKHGLFEIEVMYLIQDIQWLSIFECLRTWQGNFNMKGEDMSKND